VSGPFFLIDPFRYWKAAVRSPWGLLLAEQPQLSSCPHREGAPFLGSSLCPSSGHALRDPHLFCTEDSTLGHSTPAQVSAAQSRQAGSPLSMCWPCFFWCSLGYGWLGGPRGHIAGSCPAYHPAVPPRPFQRGLLSHPSLLEIENGCEVIFLAYVQLTTHQYLEVLFRRSALNSFISQLVLILGVAATPVQDLALGFVEPHEVLLGSLFEPVCVSTSRPPCAPHSLMSSENLLRLYLILLLMSLMKMLKSISAQYWFPEGHCLSLFIWTLSHWPPLSGYMLQTVLSVEQFTHQIRNFPIYREECCGDRVKGLIEVQIGDIRGSFLTFSTDAVTQSQKAGRLVRHSLLLVKLY